MLGMTFTSPQQPGDKTRVASPEGGGGGGRGAGGAVQLDLLKASITLSCCPAPGQTILMRGKSCCDFPGIQRCRSGLFPGEPPL